jgi:hypothetical protein
MYRDLSPTALPRSEVATGYQARRPQTGGLCLASFVLPSVKHVISGQKISALSIMPVGALPIEDGTHEYAADGILVVQVRRIGTISG